MFEKGLFKCIFGQENVRAKELWSSVLYKKAINQILIDRVPFGSSVNIVKRTNIAMSYGQVYCMRSNKPKIDRWSAFWVKCKYCQENVHGDEFMVKTQVYLMRW